MGLAVSELQHAASCTRSSTRRAPRRAAADGEPLRKVAVAAVGANPFAGRHGEDLSEMIEWGSVARHPARASALAEVLGAPVLSYGKAAIVGIAGEQEHGVALLDHVLRRRAARGRRRRAGLDQLGDQARRPRHRHRRAARAQGRALCPRPLRRARGAGPGRADAGRDRGHRGGRQPGAAARPLRRAVGGRGHRGRRRTAMSEGVGR